MAPLRLVRWLLLGSVALSAVFGCAARSRGAATAQETALRREIARLELARDASVETLVGMLRSAQPLSARLAARALGRIGGASARKALLAELGCASCAPGQLSAAAAALGVMVALDELEGAELEEVSRGLLAAWPRVPRDERAAVLEALGRGGDASAQVVLAEALGEAGAIGEAAAVALGRQGRRTLAWSESARAAVVAATAHRERALRYAATWALSREAAAGAANSAALIAALTARLTDEDPEIRAAAAAALGRRKLAASAAPALAKAARDSDWRVGVEAVRALATERDAAGLGELLVEVARARMAAAATAPSGLHVAVEALRHAAPHGAAPEVARGLRELLRESELVTPVSATAVAWLRCLAAAALARGEPATLGELVGCGGKALPPAYAVSVVLEAITSGVGDAAVRRGAAYALLGSGDERVVAATLPALVTTAAEASAAAAAADIDLVAAAVASPQPFVAGAAIEIAGKLALAAPDPAPWRQAPEVIAALERLTSAMVARAATERDPELASTLLVFIAERRLAAGLAACRAAAVDSAAVTARAGRRCVVALGYAAPPPSASPPRVAPVDLELGLPAGGRPWRWLVVTNRGELEIELDSRVAPWHVATIVELTRRGFYDGIDFHRVVADFVVQGGDPTETGSGGPGFSLPAEPGSMLDGDSYSAGATGFADAGKDSGGSQWFVMHARAPHLEGRYTRVGRVRRGQDVIDRLLVGDHVLSARVLAP